MLESKRVTENGYADHYCFGKLCSMYVREFAAAKSFKMELRRMVKPSEIAASGCF